jgi:hypothetical protein
VDPKVFVTDPDPTFQGVSDPDQDSTFKKLSYSHQTIDSHPVFDTTDL